MFALVMVMCLFMAGKQNQAVTQLPGNDAVIAEEGKFQ
jgi:hypothetical protein